MGRGFARGGHPLGGNQLLLSRYRRRAGSQGTLSSRYCYSVWLRHLIRAQRAGALMRVPRHVAELGPGNSMGVGLAALLCGSTSYRALDVVRHALTGDNLRVLNDLVDLVSSRAPVPPDKEFPQITTQVEDGSFPHTVIEAEDLAHGLEPERVRALRHELLTSSDEGEHIRYSAPWTQAQAPGQEQVDFLLSMSVLEHVDELDAAYRAPRRWLAPGGLMSNEIDFGSHGLDARWDGHWSCSRAGWAVIRGRRPYLINRVPLSGHLERCQAAGLEIVAVVPRVAANILPRERLATEFRQMSDSDRETRTAWVLVRAPL